LSDILPKLAADVRRMPVIDAHGKVTNLITQSSVLRFFHEHIGDIGELAHKPVQELGLASGDVPTIQDESPALAGFRAMVAHRCGSVAIVDETGSLCTNLSMSDIKGVAYEHSVKSLLQSAMSFVASVRQRSTRVCSVLRYEHVWFF